MSMKWHNKQGGEMKSKVIPRRESLPRPRYCQPNVSADESILDVGGVWDKRRRETSRKRITPPVFCL